jgi:hypothetical protein
MCTNSNRFLFCNSQFSLWTGLGRQAGTQQQSTTILSNTRVWEDDLRFVPPFDKMHSERVETMESAGDDYQTSSRHKRCWRR